MHVRDSRAFGLWQQAAEKIAECEVFAAEIPLNQLEHSEEMLLEAAPLRGVLPARKFKQLRGLLRKGIGLDIKIWDHLPPILIFQLIDEALLSRDYPVSLDESLWHYAQKEGRLLQGLETLAEQAGFLQQLSCNFQVRQLMELGRRWPRHRRQTIRMASLYEAEEIDKLYQCARQGAGRMRKLLLLDRNSRMAERLGRLVRSNTTFCAVGAAHLSGGKGMLRLLKKAGFTVKPVKPAYSTVSLSDFE